MYSKCPPGARRPCVKGSLQELVAACQTNQHIRSRERLRVSGEGGGGGGGGYGEGEGKGERADEGGAKGGAGLNSGTSWLAKPGNTGSSLEQATGMGSSVSQQPVLAARQDLREVEEVHAIFPSDQDADPDYQALNSNFKPHDEDSDCDDIKSLLGTDIAHLRPCEKTVAVDDILFTQRTISSCFHNGRRFHDLIDGLSLWNIDPMVDDFLILEAFEFDRGAPGQTSICSIDNRRLWCLKKHQDDKRASGWVVRALTLFLSLFLSLYFSLSLCLLLSSYWNLNSSWQSAMYAHFFTDRLGCFVETVRTL